VHATLDPTSHDAHGNSAIGAPEFLIAGDARVHAVHFDKADCRGFLAVGAKHTQDVELRVQDLSGKLLATSEGPTTTPFVFHCGAAGESAVVVLRVLDGQGEVVFAPLAHSQLDAAAQQSLASCPAVGTPRPAPIDVGPEPHARAINEELDHVSAQLAPLGYHAERMVAYGTLANEAHNASVVQLEPERCYALVAVGSRDVGDIDLRVFDPSVSFEPLEQDIARRRDALVKLCAGTPGRYVLDAAAFVGEGAYAVQLYGLDEPANVPRSVTGKSRISYAESVARMRARGFTPETLDSSVVSADTSLTRPLSLQGGSCYAVAAVASGGSAAGRLELALTDEGGELLALSAGNNDDPMVFDCPRETSSRKVIVRTKDAHGAGRFVLLLGRESP
jgi:hypothetical protein